MKSMLKTKRLFVVVLGARIKFTVTIKGTYNKKSGKRLIRSNTAFFVLKHPLGIYSFRMFRGIVLGEFVALLTNFFFSINHDF